MKRLRIINRTRDSVLGSSVRLADDWWSRGRGFLGHSEPRPGEGLLLSPCRAVHAIGMRFALDVVFLDANGRVLALYPAFGRARKAAWHRNARYVLEVPTGTVAATGTRRGDLLVWVPTDMSKEDQIAGSGGETGQRTRQEVIR